jgi:hypothetical protein
MTRAVSVSPNPAAGSGPGIAALGGAGDHRACGECDPCEGHAEEEDHQALQERHAREAHDLQHLIDAVDRDAEAHGDEDDAREPDRERGGIRRQTRRRIVEILRGHAEPGLGGHASRAFRSRDAYRRAQGAVQRYSQVSLTG